MNETEAQFQHAVIDAARALGFRVAHFRAARTKHGWRTPVAADGKGFPDLCMAGNGRVLFAELKTRGNVLTLEQKEWLQRLRVNGAQAYLWKPEHWDELVGVLRNDKP